MLITTFGFAGPPSSPSFVRVEIRVERGILFRLSGLNSSAAKASQARIRSALIACGYRWPGKGITVNISPASRARKSTAYDIPIALAILAAEGKISPHTISNLASAGELGLDGSIRLWNTNPFSPEFEVSPLINITPITRIVAPPGAIDVHYIDNIKDHNHLTSLIAQLKKPIIQIPSKTALPRIMNTVKQNDRTETRLYHLEGEPTAKRKAVIAAAGNHNIIMMGPPGSGKTQLAKCIHSLLPDLTEEQQKGVEIIHRNSNSGIS